MTMCHSDQRCLGAGDKAVVRETSRRRGALFAWGAMPNKRRLQDGDVMNKTMK